MTLSTVSDYTAQARSQLQDLVAPYRYDDASLLTALNICWLEIARLRPDMVLNARYNDSSLASDQTQNLDALVFTGVNPSDVVPLPVQFRMPVLYFMIGFVQLKDNEDTQDTRAAALLNKFVSQLLTVAA